MQDFLDTDKAETSLSPALSQAMVAIFSTFHTGAKRHLFQLISCDAAREHKPQVLAPA